MKLETLLPVFLYRAHFVADIAEGFSCVNRGFVLKNGVRVFSSRQLVNYGDFVELPHYSLFSKIVRLGFIQRIFRQSRGLQRRWAHRQRFSRLCSFLPGHATQRDAFFYAQSDTRKTFLSYFSTEARCTAAEISLRYLRGASAVTEALQPLSFLPYYLIFHSENCRLLASPQALVGRYNVFAWDSSLDWPDDEFCHAPQGESDQTKKILTSLTQDIFWSDAQTYPVARTAGVPFKNYGFLASYLDVLELRRATRHLPNFSRNLIYWPHLAYGW